MYRSFNIWKQTKTHLNDDDGIHQGGQGRAASDKYKNASDYLSAKEKRLEISTFYSRRMHVGITNEAGCSPKRAHLIDRQVDRLVVQPANRCDTRTNDNGEARQHLRGDLNFEYYSWTHFFFHYGEPLQNRYLQRKYQPWRCSSRYWLRRMAIGESLRGDKGRHWAWTDALFACIIA